MKQKVRFNYSKLLGRMKEFGYTQEKLAQEIGISAGTMTQKLKNRAHFVTPEILAICVLLDIAGADVYTYFFALEVEKSSTAGV